MSKNKLIELKAKVGDYGLIPLRIAIGIIFIAHGGQKLFPIWGGHGLGATIKMFGQMGMPAILTVLVALTEFFGGIGVLVGLLTRLAALGISFVMLGAIFMVHIGNGFFLNWFCQPGQGHGVEYNIALLSGAITLILLGAGKYSIDSIIFKNWENRAE